MQFINQFSYLLAAGGGGLVLAVILWRWRRLPQRRLFRLGVLAIYILAAALFLLLMRYPASPAAYASVTEVEAILHDDHPTLVMLYSNY